MNWLNIQPVLCTFLLIVIERNLAYLLVVALGCKGVMIPNWRAFVTAANRVWTPNLR